MDTIIKNKINEFVKFENSIRSKYLSMLEDLHEDEMTIQDICKDYIGKDTNIMFNLYLNNYECKSYGFNGEVEDAFLEYCKLIDEKLDILSTETSIKDYEILTNAILEKLEA